MQKVLYANISKGDVFELFGIDKIVLDRWLEAGLPFELDGRFSLIKTIRWREQYHRDIERRKVDLTRLNQREVIKLLGRTRPTIFAWTKMGMPRNSDCSYDLSKVINWLPGYFDDVYKKKHRKIARKMGEVIREVYLKKESKI